MEDTRMLVTYSQVVKSCSGKRQKKIWNGTRDSGRKNEKKHSFTAFSVLSNECLLVVEVEKKAFPNDKFIDFDKKKKLFAPF